MKIYVSEKEEVKELQMLFVKNDGDNLSHLVFQDNVNIKSLEQHDKEVRLEVVKELDEVFKVLEKENQNNWNTIKKLKSKLERYNELLFFYNCNTISELEAKLESAIFTEPDYDL